ncbi:MAG: hypothetical protein R3A48_00970 [Polyangiales bacterium]
MHALVTALNVAIWRDCAAPDCEHTREYAASERAWFNTSSHTASLVVGLQEGGGRALRLDPFDGHSFCATAPEAEPDGSVPGLDRGPGYEITGCATAAARRWVRVSLPALSRLAIRGDAAVFTGCGACEFPDATGTWFNRGPGPRELRVGFASGQRPSEVEVRVRPIDPALRCDGAPLLTPEAPLRDLSFSAPGETLDACGRSHASVRFARVVVPAGQRVVVSATDAELNLLDGCTTRACVASSGGQIVWHNVTGATLSRVLAIAAGTTLPLVTMRLETPTPGGLCAMPTPLRPGETVTVVGPDALGELHACSRPTRWFFYQVEVPPGLRLVARAYPPGSRANPTVSHILAGCEPASCPEWRELEPSLYLNDTGATRPMLVAVSTDGGYRTLEATVERPGTNGRCSSAIRVAMGTTLREQRTVDAVEAAPGSCSITGPALYYAVRVGARRRLVVSSGELSSNRIISVRDGCDGPCLPVERGSRRNVAVTTWINASDAAREVIVMLQGPLVSADLGFDEEPIP